MAWRLPLLLACSQAILGPGHAQDPGDLASDAQACRVGGASAESWLRGTRRQLAEGEYAYTKRADGTYAAPNRSQGLRSRIDDHGIEVVARDSSTGATEATWRLSLRTCAIGFDGERVPLHASERSCVGRRVERQADGIREWYVNEEDGIEHGWTILARPQERSVTCLRIEVETAGLLPRIDADGLSAVFLDGQQKVRIRYRGLKAWDASGRVLAAALSTEDGGLAVEVACEGARFPLTVDPVLSGPAWTDEADQIGAYYGWSVAGAGDVNGDGYDDILVGAPLYDDTALNEGRAFLYYGAAEGASTTPDWTANGLQFGAEYGYSVAGAGDVNGDGFDDLLIGARGFHNGQAGEGRAFLYFGSPNGPAHAADWTAESNQAYASFGCSVSGAGDVNGDGFDDVLIGAYGFDNPETSEGRAFLYYGSPSGPSTSPDWTAESDQANAYLGEATGGAGDVNGDGYDDVLVGAFGFDNGQADEGRAYLYLGSPVGPSLVPDWIGESDQVGAYFGTSVAGAVDVDGDGFDDVIVGADWYHTGQTEEGRAYLYQGSSSGLSTVPAWTADGNHVEAHFGYSVAGVADVNGDGFDDVLVGAPHYSGNVSLEGAAYLYLGSSNGLGPTASWNAESERVHSHFGGNVAGAGDVNGDGHGDVLVGAEWFDNGEDHEGRTFLYLGSGGDVGDAYCASTSNSLGAPARLSAAGTASSSHGDLSLCAYPVPSEYGRFFHGSNQTNQAFGCGFLCVTGNIEAGALLRGAGDVARTTYDNSDSEHDLSAHVGSTRYFQYWYRDRLGAPNCSGETFNTSNALRILILP